MATEFLTKRVAKFVYDVTGGKDSGAAGTHKIGVLPANSVITHAWYHVLDTFTSATDAATLSLGYTGATGEFKASIAISDGTNPWDAGLHVCSNSLSTISGVTNFVDIGTASLAVVAVSATETITAGKVALMVEYYVKK